MTSKKRGEKRRRKKLRVGRYLELVGSNREDYTKNLLRELKDKGDVRDFKSSRELDRAGIDFWVKLKDGREVWIDVKSSREALSHTLNEHPDRRKTVLFYIPNLSSSAKQEMARLLSLMKAYQSEKALLKV